MRGLFIFGTARRGLGGRPLLAVPNVRAHPSTSYYSIWHYNYLHSKGLIIVLEGRMVMLYIIRQFEKK